MNLQPLVQASLFTKFGLLVSAAPLVAGIFYVLRPNERRLALMRPLSLAGIFASISSLLLGLANALYSMSASGSGADASYRFAARQLSEAVIPTFVGFACLTVAWLCVATAIRRST